MKHDDSYSDEFDQLTGEISDVVEEIPDRSSSETLIQHSIGEEELQPRSKGHKRQIRPDRCKT